MLFSTLMSARLSDLNPFNYKLQRYLMFIVHKTSVDDVRTFCKRDDQSNCIRCIRASVEAKPVSLKINEKPLQQKLCLFTSLLHFLRHLMQRLQNIYWKHCMRIANY